jgi:hypothetical protein
MDIQSKVDWLTCILWISKCLRSTSSWPRMPYDDAADRRLAWSRCYSRRGPSICDRCCCGEEVLMDDTTWHYNNQPWPFEHPFRCNGAIFRDFLCLQDNAVLLYSRTVSIVQSYSTTTYLVYRQERRRGGGGQEAVRSRTGDESVEWVIQTGESVIRTVQSYVDHSGTGPGTK